MQKLYWSTNSSFTYEKQQTLTKTLAAELERIRQKCRSDKLVAENLMDEFEEDDIDPTVCQKLFESMKITSVSCSEMMSNLAGEIIGASIDILSKSPSCSFQAVAIGSLARGEATPYSDIEFIFLIERKTENIMAYFERLAVTSYFLIGNLQETKLSYMAIEELKWFDDKARNGFKIDGLSLGAGNIPTGNGTKDEKNRFITTPEALATLYKRVLKNPQEEALRGDLTAMLTYTKAFYSHGQKDLRNVFRKKVQNLKPNQDRRTMNMNMLKADAEKFKYDLSCKLMSNGYTANVKKELYRLPSILLLDIVIVLGQQSSTSWEALECLIHQQRISHDIGVALKLSLAAAVFIRLSAYLFYNCHDDKISCLDHFYPKTPARTDVYHFWSLPVGLFSQVIASMIPLKSCLSKSNFQIADLQTTVKITENIWSKLARLYYLGRHHEALSIINEAGAGDPVAVILNYSSPNVSNETIPLVLFILVKCEEWNLVISLMEFVTPEMVDHGIRDLCILSYAEALAHMERCDLAVEYILATDDPAYQDYAQRVLGCVYSIQQRYMEAEQCYLRYLQLQLDNIASDDVPTDYYGNPLLQLQTAIKQPVDITGLQPSQILALMKTATPCIVTGIISLGKTYRLQRLFSLSQSYMRKALELSEKLYGMDAALFSTGLIYCDLGISSMMQADYNEAEKCFVRSSEIFSHRSSAEMSGVADSLQHLGAMYCAQSEYVKSERVLLRALARYRKSKASDITVANTRSLNFLGIAYIYGPREDFYLGMEYQYKALSLLQSLHPKHLTGMRTRAEVLSQLGLSYEAKGNVTSAKAKYSEAHDILARCFHDHPFKGPLSSSLSIQPGPLYDISQCSQFFVFCLHTKNPLW